MYIIYNYFTLKMGDAQYLTILLFFIYFEKN